MRTTVRLEEGLFRAVRAEAARGGETVTALIERGLRLVLAGGTRKRGRTRVSLPGSRAKGDTRPGVNLDDTSAVLDILDRR